MTSKRRKRLKIKKQNTVARVWKLQETLATTACPIGDKTCTREVYILSHARCQVYWSCVIYCWQILTRLIIHENITGYVFSTFKVNELISVDDDVIDRGQDRQCTYKVTFRRVRAVIVAVESNKYYIFRVCVCSPRYPARNVHVPYHFVICDLPGSSKR